jgi:Flp pilus assembly protein TadG
MPKSFPLNSALTFMLLFSAAMAWIRHRRFAAARRGSLPDPLTSPPRQSKRDRSRRSGQRGAEMVELGFVVIPLFGMTFMLLDVSMVIFLRSTFQHAVREGVRYAITGQNTTGPCQDDSIKAVVKQNAAGFLNSTKGTTALHVHFISPVNGSVTNNAYGNIVEVSVESYSFGPLAAYLKASTPLQITARAYDMMEAMPGALPCITKVE